MINSGPPWQVIEAFKSKKAITANISFINVDRKMMFAIIRVSSNEIIKDLVSIRTCTLFIAVLLYDNVGTIPEDFTRPNRLSCFIHWYNIHSLLKHKILHLRFSTITVNSTVASN